MDLAAQGNDNVYDLLNSVFYLPAIAVGIEKEIWNITFTKSKRSLPIIEIWSSLGLLNSEGRLTEKGKKIIEIKSLIKYIIRMVPYHACDDLEKFNKIPDSEYDLLRKGLGEYFLTYQNDLFEKLGYCNQEWRVLDYAGGQGRYSYNFLKYNPKSYCTILDRYKQCEESRGIQFKEVDFEKNPDWYKEYKNKYDLIILSEILHCKDASKREYLIKSAYGALDNEGEILVIEKTPTPYFQWRMDMFTHQGKCISWMEIEKLGAVWGLEIKKKHDLKSHYCVVLTRKQKGK